MFPIFRNFDEEIMSYYSKEKNKIIMPSSKFYEIRHGHGLMNNNGLFFPRGYEKSPVYKRNGEYIKIKLI